LARTKKPARERPEWLLKFAANFRVLKNVVVLYCMKKVLATILAFTYLALASGVVVSVHYCMGEVAGVAIGHSNADTCGTCGMENDGCCHDDVSVVKVQDSHAMATAQVDLLKAEYAVQQREQPFHVPAVLSAAYAHPVAHGPPDAATPPLHILHCVFRI
jgi:hypothetical protein